MDEWYDRNRLMIDIFDETPSNPTWFPKGRIIPTTLCNFFFFLFFYKISFLKWTITNSNVCFNVIKSKKKENVQQIIITATGYNRNKFIPCHIHCPFKSDIENSIYPNNPILWMLLWNVIKYLQKSLTKNTMNVIVNTLFYCIQLFMWLWTKKDKEILRIFFRNEKLFSAYFLLLVHEYENNSENFLSSISVIKRRHVFILTV